MAVTPTKMFTIDALRFPVIAMTPIGVMPYSKPESLQRCMPREFKMGWYSDLEIIDSEGACAVIRSATLANVPFLARLFGRMVEVRLDKVDKLANYDLPAMKDRVLEFLEIYQEPYESAGMLERMIKSVKKAKTPADIVVLFVS